MKLYNKNELKDSRIFFDQRPPIFLSIFIVFSLVMVLLAVYFSTVAIKPYIVKAQGTVTTSDNKFISSLVDGEVVSINAAEGQKVAEGDVLFTISNGQEGLQVSALSKQVSELTTKLEVLDKYETSLNKQVNNMKNSDIEQGYYGKVEYYLLQLKTDKMEKENLVNQLNKKKGKKGQLDSELNTLIKNLSSIEDTEENSLKRSEIQATIDSKKGELDSINEEISQLESQINSPSSQSKQIYTQLLSELGSTREDTQSKLTELKGQIDIYSGQESSLVVKAKNPGTVHYLSPLTVGMTIRANEIVGEISQNSNDDLQIEAYIDAQDISKVKIGHQVKVAIKGVNSQKYGTLSGELLSIDSGTITQETSNGNLIFYRCLISLSNKELIANDGNVVKLIKSMPIEARIVYEKETYFDFVLKMVNFKN